MKGIQNTADEQEITTFGDALRGLRTARGLSLADLSQRTHYSRGHLNNVERGVKAPTMELAHSCDQVLESGQTLQALVPQRRWTDQARALRPAQLPTDSPRFVGRAPQLDMLDQILTARPGTAMVVVHGTPGVGKTALALRWAHRQVDRFPDGQLFVDLRAYGPTGTSADPGGVLEEFLIALGWPSTEMPSGVEERARLFRSMMRDRRMLVVLDNAASSVQVRPLLPAGPSSAVLITSRMRLEGLVVREGASELALAPFDTSEALDLLRELLGASRVEATPDMAEQVASWCGHLPLAVCLAAQRIAGHPNFSMDILAADLAETHARLDTLAASDDADTAVRTIFSWSYNNLAPASARTFRLLGLHAGPDIGLPAAAALCDRTIDQIRPDLELLANSHLIEQTRPGRFRLHDLLHAYAAERVLTEDTDSDRLQAVLRVVCWYLHATETSRRALGPTQPLPAPHNQANVEPQLFANYHDAFEWCEMELANIAAAVDQAAAIGRHDLAWRLPGAAFEFFHVRKPWSVWEKTYRTGLAAARCANERPGEAYMLQGLGVIDLGHHRYCQARDHFEQALAIRADLNDHAGQAWSLTGLGQTLTELGQHDQARTALERALALHQRVTDHQGEAVSLIFLAEDRRRRSDHLNALADAERALAISREFGDLHCEGLALHELSATCLAAGQLPQALSYLREAVEVRHRAGDRRGEADTLRLLAETLQRAGESAEAAARLHQALDILQARDDPAAGEVRTQLEGLADTTDGH